MSVGVTYTVSFCIKSGTSGDGEMGRIFVQDPSWVSLVNMNKYTTGDWVQYSATFVATDTDGYVTLEKFTDTPGTMLFDTISISKFDGLVDSPLSSDGVDVDNSGVYKIDGATVVDQDVTTTAGPTFDHLHLTSGLIVGGVDMTSVYPRLIYMGG
jgi:hypothetical protein